MAGGGKAEGSGNGAGGAGDGLETDSSEAEMGGVGGAETPETPLARRSDSLRIFLMSMECSNGAAEGAHAAVGTDAHAGSHVVARKRGIDGAGGTDDRRRRWGACEDSGDARQLAVAVSARRADKFTAKNKRRRRITTEQRSYTRLRILRKKGDVTDGCHQPAEMPEILTEKAMITLDNP